MPERNWRKDDDGQKLIRDKREKFSDELIKAKSLALTNLEAAIQESYDSDHIRSSYEVAILWLDSVEDMQRLLDLIQQRILELQNQLRSFNAETNQVDQTLIVVRNKEISNLTVTLATIADKLTNGQWIVLASQTNFLSIVNQLLNTPMKNKLT